MENINLAKEKNASSLFVMTNSDLVFVVFSLIDLLVNKIKPLRIHHCHCVSLIKRSSSHRVQCQYETGKKDLFLNNL